MGPDRERDRRKKEVDGVAVEWDPRMKGETPRAVPPLDVGRTSDPRDAGGARTVSQTTLQCPKEPFWARIGNGTGEKKRLTKFQGKEAPVRTVISNVDHPLCPCDPISVPVVLGAPGSRSRRPFSVNRYPPGS